jgi:hypothetical protein
MLRDNATSAPLTCVLRQYACSVHTMFISMVERTASEPIYYSCTNLYKKMQQLKPSQCTVLYHQYDTAIVQEQHLSYELVQEMSMQRNMLYHSNKLRASCLHLQYILQYK